MGGWVGERVRVQQAASGEWWIEAAVRVNICSELCEHRQHLPLFPVSAREVSLIDRCCALLMPHDGDMD